MTYVRPIRFEPGTFLRPCEICGIRFRANQLVRGPDAKFRCLRWCAEQTLLERDRISSESSKRREAPPPPFGVPYVFKDAYTGEANVFNFLVNNRVVDSGWTGGARLGAAPGDTFKLGGNYQVTQGLYSNGSAGETMRYLALLITENLRPSSWITRAKIKLRELADWVITVQRGFGVSPSSTQANDVAYGGVVSQVPLIYSSAEQGQLGYGMLVAYQILGDIKYLTSARAFADFIVNLQAGGLVTVGPSTSDSAGNNPVNYGAWTRFYSSTNGHENVYQADSLVCLEFLSALKVQVGDESHGASTTVAGFFTQAPRLLLSVSISNARAFWSVGAVDATLLKVVTGLSSTTPADFFNSFPSSKTGWSDGDGTWSRGLDLVGSRFAMALRALYNSEGYSAQVSSVWLWLMAFTANPTFKPTTTSRALDLPAATSFNGTYDPKLSLTTSLKATTAVNGSATYDWQCAGMLSPIQGAIDPGSLDLAKDFVLKGSTVFPVTDVDYGRNGSDVIACIGQSGLNGATHTTSTTNFTWRADYAAAIGQMFRYGNKSFTFQV